MVNNNKIRRQSTGHHAISSLINIEKESTMNKLSVEQADENIKKGDQHHQFNDVISSTIRKGTFGCGLVGVVLVSTIMATISVVLMKQYEAPGLTLEEPSDEFEEDSCSIPIPAATTTWVTVMLKQIQIIQNLVHASLLGGAGFVAAFRGDAVWLFFARNCSFYFFLAAASYAVVQVVSKNRRQHDKPMLIFSTLLAVACCGTFVRLESVRWKVNKVLRNLVAKVDNKSQDSPSYVPSSPTQIARSFMISHMIDWIQVVAIAYTVTITVSAVLVSKDDCNMSGTRLSHLEISYAAGAHQAFLLSLLMAVCLYPRKQSFVGGAVICSGWRCLLALCYLPGLLKQSYHVADTRVSASLFLTTLELVMYLPILTISLLMARENMSHTMRSEINIEYSRINRDDDDEEEEVDAADVEATDENDVHRQTIHSPLSLRLISKSMLYSYQQQWGALILWSTSASLFIGMTLECLLLVKVLGQVEYTNYTSDIYRWGMHVAAMYLFCTHMNVAGNPSVYQRARVLLAIACPAGSLIALWQMHAVYYGQQDFNDVLSITALCLFLWRALCGIGQTIGLIMLKDTEPLDQSNDSENNSIRLTSDEASQLEGRRLQARFVLYKVYIPTMVLSIACEAFFFSCSEPFLSPTTPGCRADFFLQAAVLPGFGTFFHFAGLLVIFSSDAVSEVSYPPSLAVGTVFSGHFAVLLLGDLLNSIVDVRTAHVDDAFQYYMRFLTMISTVALFCCLARLWKMKSRS